MTMRRVCRERGLTCHRAVESTRGGRWFYPVARGEGEREFHVGSEWNSPPLVTFGKRTYFVAAMWMNDPQYPGMHVMFRLRANGTVVPVCAISQKPAEDLYAAFVEIPDVEAFIDSVRIVGNPGPDKGTLRAESRHTMAALRGERAAASRPWVIADRDEGGNNDLRHYVYGFTLDQFLEQWSLREPWTRREYQTLLSLLPSAKVAYAKYLTNRFGLAPRDAGPAADRVINGVLAQYVMVGGGGDFCCGEPDTRMIVARDRPRFEALLAQVAERKDAKELYSKWLPLAVEWPYAFDRLLALGADPDVGNKFGKTALMTAAHFNRPDAVRKLLKAGAHVNAQTIKVSDYDRDYNLRRA